MFWIQHPEQAWLPGTRKSGRDGDPTVVFETIEGEAIKVLAKDVENLIPVQPDQLTGVEDVCSLGVVHEGALVHSVRIRYNKDLIYTRVARTLIAVNPFCALPIYNSQQVDRYASIADSIELPPHIYGIGQDALQGLRSGSGRNQAVLISGESGAGKTESAKLILAYVADAVRRNAQESDEAAQSKPLEDRVQQTNAVLEAFGNSMTARNNNSSRFGKWLDLRFSSDLGLLGCSLTSYLLETMRCCRQAGNERSFHVFYQLCQAKQQPLYAELGLRDPKKYRYLANGQLKAPGIDDARGFSELQEALADLGFERVEIADVFRIVAGVMMLGNIELKGSGDESEVKDHEALLEAAALLGFESEGLERCIISRKIVVAGDVTQTPLRLEQANTARDSLARLLYGRLFLYLISCMNRVFQMGDADGEMSPCSRHAAGERLLGILDIAGFESFEKNSLEQLLINLSNEHLHQRFNEFVFKAEVEESAKEGVTVPNAIDFTDNADILGFIDAKGGILELLDDTMSIPKADGMVFVTKVLKEHAKHPVLVAPRVSRCAFGIRHFAGEVTYDCEGWLEKNQDRPPDEAMDLLTMSKLQVLRDLAAMMESEQMAAEGGTACGTGSQSLSLGPQKIAGRGGKRKARSVSAFFRTSLRHLMDKISTSDPHYVLCMKPNMQKVPRRFMGPAVMEQLLLTGVLSAVQIRQQGYAYRVPHTDFCFEYRCIVDTARKTKGARGATKTVGREDAVRLVEALPGILKGMGHTDIEPEAFAVGYTKVFFKFAVHKSLQDGRRSALWSSAANIQRVFRGFVARRHAAERQKVRDQIRKVLLPLNLSALGRKSFDSGESLMARLPGAEVEAAASDILVNVGMLLEEAEGLNFRGPDVIEATRVSKKLQYELEVLTEVTKAEASLDSIEVERALCKAQTAGLPIKQRLDALAERLSHIRTQTPLNKAIKDAAAKGPTVENVNEEEVAKIKEIVDAVEAAGLISNPQAWLPGYAKEELETLRVFLATVEENKRMLAAELALAQAKASGDAAAAARAEELVLAEAARATELKDRLLKEEAEKEAQEEESSGDEAPMNPTKSKLTSVRRKTVTGLGVADQVKILTALRKAAEEYDLEALESLLQQADANGMEDTCKGDDSCTDPEARFGVDTARAIFRQLQGQDFLMEEIARAREEAKEPVAPVMALRRLEHLSRQLGQVPGREEEAAEAQSFLQKAVVNYSQGTRKRVTVFDSEDPEELDLASKIFGEVSAFSRLKPAKEWMSRCRSNRSRANTMGRRRKSTFQPKQDGHVVEGMMLYSKTLCESLTWHPEGDDEEEYDSAAVQNFRNILVAMGDRPAQECQRVASREAVIMLAKCEPKMQAEVYMQSIKQLIKNPVPRSVAFGWELLHQLVTKSPPADELQEFVRAWITKGVSQMEPSAVTFFYALRVARVVGCRGELFSKK